MESDKLNTMKNMIDIPLLHCTDGIVYSCKLDPDNFPPWSKIRTTLKDMNAKLYTWIKFSMEYNKKGDIDGFVNLLENARNHASVEYQNNEKDQIHVRNMLIEYYTKTANVAYKEHDNKRALSYYRKAMKCNPNNTHIRVAIARCFVRLRKLKKAINSYLHAIRIDDKCIVALLGVATIQIQIGNEHDGEAFLKKACTIDKTNPVVLNQMADYSFARKSYDQCKLLAYQALNNTDDHFLNAESYYILGRTYDVQGKYEKAFKYYCLASSSSPKTFVLAQYGLGKMYIHKGETGKAIKCFKKVLQHQPGDIGTLKILGFLYASSKTNYVKMNIGKMKLKRVTEKCPKDHESWLGLAELCKVSDPKASLEAYNTAIDLIRQSNECYISPVVLNNVGVLHYNFKNFDECRVKIEESLAVLKEIIITDPKHRDCLVVTTAYNLARTYDELLNDTVAEKLYRLIFAEYSDYTDCYVRLGVIAERSKKMNEAYVWYKKALKVDSGNVEALQLIRKFRPDINSTINMSVFIPTERNGKRGRSDIFNKSTDTTSNKRAKGVVETTTHANDAQANKNQSIIELKTTISARVDVSSIENPIARKKTPKRKKNPPKNLKVKRKI